MSMKDPLDSARIEAQEAREAALTEQRRSHKEPATPERGRCELLYDLARRFFTLAAEHYAGGAIPAGYFYWEQGHRALADAMVCEGIVVIHS